VEHAERVAARDAAGRLRAALFWVDMQIDVLPTWSSFVTDDGQTAKAEPAAAVAAGPARPDAGRILTFKVNGEASKLDMLMYAYVPPGYDANPGTRYPVIEALHGYPGNPLLWLRQLTVAKILDQEIAAGRMAPTIVLFPYQTPKPLLDTECINLVGGPQIDTFLTQDVPAYARAHLRVRVDGGGWGLIGYSAGAYCATNLLLHHPGQYIAAASLSGYATPGIKVGDDSEHTTNDDAWRLTHLPIPAVALYLACARTDATALRNTETMAQLAHKPISLTTAYVNGGGHNAQTWQAMETSAFDWLATWLGQPTTANAPVPSPPPAATPGHP
jgi:enterochelin esterase-like enzyme